MCIETTHRNHIKHQVKDHKVFGTFSQGSTTFLFLNINEEHVVFVHEVFYPEIDGTEQWNEGDDWAEEKAVEEDYESLDVAVGESEFFLVHEFCFDLSMSLFAVVEESADKNTGSVASIK